SDGMDQTEFMHLFTATEWKGELKECDEGNLEWVPKDDVIKLPHWDGDLIFLSLLEQGEPFFSLKLTYKGSTLTEALLNEEPVRWQDFV
ncbi:MAG: DNA mismatch repair protein MutT, partial [Fibrobacter sp.]|nr:DNA mismatch repair protein MutT [Fibrobacter sp.]